MKRLGMGMENGLSSVDRPVIIKQWISKESFETSYISICTVGNIKVVEIECINILDELLLEFNMAKGRKEKGVVRERYKVAAKEINSFYTKPLYNPEL